MFSRRPTRCRHRQPALICELVDWARACGYEVVCAGKGMDFEPHFRYSTPETVWDYFGFTEEQVRAGDLNPQMFNSFVDGTKAAIEMAAVANATGAGLTHSLSNALTLAGASTDGTDCWSERLFIRNSRRRERRVIGND